MTDVLDEALQAISCTAPEFANGNSNHAPMVAETLIALNRHNAVMPWVEAYCRDLGQRPANAPSLDGDWRHALGKTQEWPAWVALFREELQELHWTEVVESWTVRLAPGLSGAAMHGLLRTAHAVRSLGEVESQPRLDELADALAYWAASYHAFGTVPSLPRHFNLDSALSQVPNLNVDTPGSIDDAFRQLDASTAFGPVINLLGTGPDPLTDLSQLTERFAALYLCNAPVPDRTFAMVHAITGPSSLRLLEPYVPKSTLELLLLYIWQAAGAIYGIWARDRSDPLIPKDPPEADALIDAALANGTAHAIKLVEASLREHKHNPTPVYLAVAADAVQRLMA
jgi:hypothetical protein